jgi:Cu/Ag efflux protein CusF
VKHGVIVAPVIWLALAAQSLALEATGVVKKVDAEAGVIVVFAGGMDRTLKVAGDAQFLDAAGKPLPDGLKAKEVREGAEVTMTVERAGNAPTLKALRLGARAGATPAGGPPGPGPAAAGRSSTGVKPLNEMTAQEKYKGEAGGLYGEGRNEPPEAHRAAARAEGAKIAPLDAEGHPAKDGTIALVSISMSNATQEFSVFKGLADADAGKSPRVTIVDCAQGGQAMAQWVDPQGKAWKEADRRLEVAKVSPKQVQAAWVKLANVGPSGELTEHGRKLQRDTLAVLHNAKARFPNLRIAYLGSRIYGGWATTRLNPEPYAFEGAFAARWLIQDQARGSAELAYDAAGGGAKAPLLLWGPYLWGDGLTPRADGLVWERADFVADGTHPSTSGRRKVAELLLKFFKTEETAKGWFAR